MTFKPIILRTSERTTFKSCQQKWWWSARMGLKPKRESDKLTFGSGVHDALAQWYLPGFTRGAAPAKTFLKWFKDEETYVKTQGLNPDEAEWVEAAELGAAMLLNYVDTYGRDEDWDVISTEQTVEAQIEMPEAPGGYIIYTGTFDGVFRLKSDHTLWLMEHKTAAALPNTGYLELDDQAGTYYMLAENTLRAKGLIGENEHLDGIMYNFLRKAMPDDRPQNQWGQYLNKNGTISKQQGGPHFLRHPVWRSDSQRMMQRKHIVDEVRQMIELRAGHQQITKTPTRDCQWACAFFQMCQLHESGDDWEAFRDAMFIKRDPYSDHRANLKMA